MLLLFALGKPVYSCAFVVHVAARSLLVWRCRCGRRTRGRGLSRGPRHRYRTATLCRSTRHAVIRAAVHFRSGPLCPVNCTCTDAGARSVDIEGAAVRAACRLGCRQRRWWCLRRFAFVLGSGVGGASESSANSLSVSSVDLDAEGFHTGKRWAIRFIPAEIQGRRKRTVGPASVLVWSVSFET